MPERETQRRLLEIADELEHILFCRPDGDYAEENYAGHLFAEAVDLGALKTLPDEVWRDIRKRIHAHRYGSAKPNWGLGAFDKVAGEVMEQGWVIDQHQEFICRKVAGLIRQSVDVGDASTSVRQIEHHSTGSDADAAVPTAESVRRRKVKQPSSNDFRAYLATVVGGLTQPKAAEMLTEATGEPWGQSRVSRRVKAVKDWIEAGNSVPTIESLPPSSRRTITVDPSILDIGERMDGRTVRQRQRRSDDDDADWQS